MSAEADFEAATVLVNSNINSDLASYAWEWFARQRHQTYMLQITCRAREAQRDVLDKIRRDFQWLQMELRLKAGKIYIGVDRASGPDRTVFSIHHLPWEGRP